MKSVFISSTFKDMQAERDYFHEKVFPRLRAKVKVYGENIQELDLRWGVDTANMTEEESGRQVLKVCIDAIDRCKPYTIVLIGERYGWIPGMHIINEANDVRVNAHYQENMSITNLEIKYAALDDREILKRCIFCFRSESLIDEIEEPYREIFAAESSFHREKLNRLKEEIRRLPDAKIVDYKVTWDTEKHRVTGMEELGERVYGLLAEMIEEECEGKEPKTLQEHLSNEISVIKERYLSSYIPRGREEYAILRHLVNYQVRNRTEDRDVPYTYVCGEAGTGKSALMAACENRLSENGEYTILYFCGAPGCQSVTALKKMMVYRLEQILEVPIGRTEGKLNEKLQYLNAKIGMKKIYCFVDALDQLFSDMDEWYLDIFTLCPDIYFVLSALPEFPINKILEKAIRKAIRVEITGLARWQAKALIDATTKRRGKKLDDEVVEDMLQKKGAVNPLYLSLILQRFFMMDGAEFQAAEALAPGMEGLHQYMEQLLDQMPEDKLKMIRYLMEVTGARFQSKDFMRILQLLAVSRYGLTEAELEQIFKMQKKQFSQVRFQQIVSYMYDAFCISGNGKWDFGHRLFTEAVIENKDVREIATEQLADYAAKDKEFLMDEGFYYVLMQKRPEGADVLEYAKDSENRSNIYDYVAYLLKNDGGAERYFAQMLDGDVRESVADFWLEGFKGSDYGAVCRRRQSAMQMKLLEQKTLSARQRVIGLIKLTEYELEQKNLAAMERYLAQGFKEAENLAEPEHSYYLARLLFLEGEIHYDKGEEEKGLHYDDQACALADRAFGQLDAQKKCRLWHPALVQKIRYQCIFIRECCRQKEVFHKDRLITEMTSLESVKSDLSAADYAACKLNLLRTELMLCKRDRNMSKEQVQTCTDEVLKQARELVQSYPSTDNLHGMMSIFYLACERVKKAEQYSLYREMVGYVRRIYERQPNGDNKYDLAHVLISYAERADIVLNNDPSHEVKKEIGDSAEKGWQEGFVLLEELRSEGYRDLDDLRYGYCLMSYCRCRIDRSEDDYETILEKCRQLLDIYAKTDLKSSRYPEYLFDQDLRDANHYLGLIYKTRHEAHKSVCYIKTACEYASKVFQAKRTGANLESYLTLLHLYTQALYMGRHDEEALAKASEVENILDAYGIDKNQSGIWKEILYIHGRIAFERGQIEVAKQYGQLAKENVPSEGQRTLLWNKICLLNGEILYSEGAWEEAEDLFESVEGYMRKLWLNKWMHNHMPSLAKEIRYYMEYVYRRKADIYNATGRKISENDIQTMVDELESTKEEFLKADLMRRRAMRDELVQGQMQIADGAKDETMEMWKDFERVLKRETADVLEVYLEFYRSYIKLDTVFTLPYKLRKERRNLAHELYIKTGDIHHITDYVEETEKLITKTIKGGTRFAKEKDIHIFDRGREWQREIWELCSALYLETKDRQWLILYFEYLKQTLRRKNLSDLSLYDEVFSVLKRELKDQLEQIEKVEQEKYEKDIQEVMMEFEIMHGCLQRS